MSRAAAIAGRVLHEASEVAGARVCAARWTQDLTRGAGTCVVTDAMGRYVLAELGPGSYYVTASANGLAPGSAERGAPITLLAGEVREAVDIALRPADARVAGVVLDAIGGPVAGAVVRALRADTARVDASLELETDVEGRFELAIDAGPVQLLAEADGYAAAHASVIAPSAHVTLMLTPGGIIRGHVIDASDGRPVAGVEVNAQPDTPRAALQRPSVSTADGSFEITGLEPGGYVLSGVGPRARGVLRELIAVRLAETVADVTLEVVSAVTVEGRVVLRGSGAPCAPAIVMIGPAAQTTKEGVPALPMILGRAEVDGTVRFDGVTPGVYRAAPQCVGHRAAEPAVTFEVGADDLSGLVFELEPATTLAVTVIDSARQPVPGASFGLFWLDDAGQTKGVLPVEADANGHSQVPASLEAGRYRLEPLGGYRGEPVELEVREGGARIEATLQLEGRGTLLVHAETRDGEPIDELLVVARPAGGAALRIDGDPSEHGADGGEIVAQAQGGGRYRLAPIPEGTYEVTASDGTNPPRAVTASGRAEIEVRDGMIIEASVTLDRGAILEGTVVDARGAPVASAWVSAAHEGARFGAVERGAGGRVLTDAQGAFTLTSLDEGARYVVRARDTAGAASAAVPASPGARVTLRIEEAVAEQAQALAEPKSTDESF